MLNFPINKKINIISLGAESVGRFAIYDNGKIFVSEDFGDLLDIENLVKFKKAVLKQVKCKKPDAILTDLHPLYNSTIFGNELSKKLKIPHIKVQHHIAHIFSALGDKLCYSDSIKKFHKNKSARDSSTPLCSAQNDNAYNILNTKYSILDTFFGIASDGTGYGFDGNIWGGEIFKVESKKLKVKSYRLKSNFNQKLKIKRIGSLEEQIMIGGDLAVKKPARMLISTLSKFLSKEKVYENVKKFYTKNEFELLYNQLQQNFNCQLTTSTGRILDAVSVLLGFADNKRNFKHEATKLLEKNSTIPYKNSPPFKGGDRSGCEISQNFKILNTTYLFEYLLKNIDKDKKRLAATAQEYIAKRLWEITKVETQQCCVSTTAKNTIFFAGGMANNKIISSYLEKKGVYTSKKIPRGDEGIAFGQIVYYLTNNI